MDATGSRMTAEIEAVAAAYAALNRDDTDGFVRCFHPQVERVERIGPAVSTHRGIDAVKAHVIQGRGTWAEGGCEPRRFAVAGHRVVAFVHVRVRLKDAAEWLEGDVVDVFTFREGKAIAFHTFGDVPEGLAFAGIDPAEENG